MAQSIVEEETDAWSLHPETSTRPGQKTVTSINVCSDPTACTPSVNTKTTGQQGPHKDENTLLPTKSCVEKDKYSQATSFIRTGFEASLGGPIPALFSAPESQSYNVVGTKVSRGFPNLPPMGWSPIPFPCPVLSRKVPIFRPLLYFSHYLVVLYICSLT